MNSRRLIPAALLLSALAAPLPLRADSDSLRENTREVLQDIKEGAKEAAHVTKEAVKQGWSATREYLSKDPAEYRTGADRRLNELATEISTLEDRTPGSYLADREYYKTRLAALPQHLAFAKTQLADLPATEGAAYDKAQASLNKTIGNLESAVSQAREELEDGA